MPCPIPQEVKAISQATELDQLIEYNMRIISLLKSSTKFGGQTNLSRFSLKSKIVMSLVQQS